MMPHNIILVIVCAAFIPEVIYIVRLFRQSVSEIKLYRASLRINMFAGSVGVILLLIAMMYDINFLRYKSPMPYSEWREIEWSDFRAIKRPHQTLDGIESFAFICSDIDLNISEYEVQVETRFHPARSYTFSEKNAGTALLQHELYHLHITEQCARILRRELATFDLVPTKAQINELVSKYSVKERQLQAQYDEETYHGYVLGQQLVWQQKVDSMLSQLSAYSDITVKLK